MKASVYLGKERVELREVDPPRRKEGEVLLRVKRVGICGTDLHVYQGDLDWRVKVPLVRGTSCARRSMHAAPPPVDLHQFFACELSLVGCRVYEPVDFDRAIRVAASGALDLKAMVTDILPLKDAAQGFEKMRQGGAVMKVLLDCEG